VMSQSDAVKPMMAEHTATPALSRRLLMRRCQLT